MLAQLATKSKRVEPSRATTEPSRASYRATSILSSPNYNTLHEEVHVLYSQLHPNVPADPIRMDAGPSHVAGEALGGELDLFRTPSLYEVGCRMVSYARQ